ncbi:oxidoreductase, aryl-alcohol dehydrogenase like protein [Halogeometricum borinquense DSM 11551]|uniref:Oxidoreductase, aryl-alcohol dehydrogenase like protein n=1 Tax=Halogeometricum borinquense (strain ATCC 700274 / DSM 11551 / JCM 10706 / KCTC 4070 / PR3) TaxID=469382 RepID=E4NPC6_HALBP|nr:aldo/keto reductase [Halogeometricum borinquense]ADQ66481.1 predicted oxidoreductase, aryl-alcohol dehydrogenase like protein [Halogeometricum borinquense DSM 11551]ELY31199.1 oxidoreductase, aryl-alcohol dehydrogenase like protein [Halogeometricum borinquense DSM 11551]
MALDTVSLGRTGTKVSEIAFGTWRFGRENDEGDIEVGPEQAHRLLDAYADAGGTFIDTADMYGGGRAEEYIGDWLADRDRENFVIASKIYWPTREDPNGVGLNRKHLRRNIDEILDRLGTDYVDVLYTHRWDDDTPAREFMRTLDEFVRDGKVNYLGTSTLEPNAWKIAKANEIADKRGYEPFTVSQPRYNVVNREIEGNYLDMCADYDVGVVPWSPLAGGFLTGKYSRNKEPPADSRAASDQQFVDSYLTPENFDALEAVESVAADVGASPGQVALAWLLHHDQVTAPIVGARTVDQLEENLAAAEVSLTPDQFERLADAKRE